MMDHRMRCDVFMRLLTGELATLSASTVPTAVPRRLPEQPFRGFDQAFERRHEPRPGRAIDGAVVA